MQFRRREFLRGTAAGGAGALLGGAVHESAVRAAAVTTDPTATVSLGKHIRTSRIGIGFGMRGWERDSNLSRRGVDHAEDVVRYAYESGIRFFDNADLYGSHQYVARALKDVPRESYTVATKIWYHPNGLPEDDRPDADEAVKRFLEELETDYIDVVQIHCMSSRQWTADMRKQMDLLEELKQEGVIRSHGVSCHSIPALEAAAASDWVDVVHTRINHMGTKMDGPPNEVVPVLKKIHNAGKGVVGMKLCGEGAFRDDPDLRDEAIRFVLGAGCVDVMIVGFELPKEIDDFKSRVAQALELQQAQA